MTTSTATQDQATGRPSPSLGFRLVGVLLQAAAATALVTIDPDAPAALTVGSVAIAGPLIATVALIVALVGAMMAMPGLLLPYLFVAMPFLALGPVLLLDCITVQGLPLYQVLHLANSLDALLVGALMLYWGLANLLGCLLAPRGAGQPAAA